MGGAYRYQDGPSIKWATCVMKHPSFISNRPIFSNKWTNQWVGHHYGKREREVTNPVAIGIMDRRETGNRLLPAASPVRNVVRVQAALGSLVHQL